MEFSRSEPKPLESRVIVTIDVRSYVNNRWWGIQASSREALRTKENLGHPRRRDNFHISCDRVLRPPRPSREPPIPTTTADSADHHATSLSFLQQPPPPPPQAQRPPLPPQAEAEQAPPLPPLPPQPPATQTAAMQAEAEQAAVQTAAMQAEEEQTLADEGEEEFLTAIAVAAWYLPPALVEAGWRVFVDPGSDQTYYYNIVTEEATWHPPAPVPADGSGSYISRRVHF